MTSLQLDSSIQYLKGVGPKLAQVFQKQSIFTLYDLFTYYPKSYSDRRIQIPYENWRSSLSTSLCGIISSFHTKRISPKLFLSTVTLQDIPITLRFFNQVFLKKTFTIGSQFAFFGEIQQKGSSFFMDHPDFEDPSSPPIHTRIVTPIYSQIGPLSSKRIRTLIWNALHAISTFPDPLPISSISNLTLPSLKDALTHIHFPPDKGPYQRARFRLVYEEFFHLYASLITSNSSEKITHRSKTPQMLIKQARQDFLKLLPFQLTPDQTNACLDIAKDFLQDVPMVRLLQGDVGCGKTIVSLFPTLITLLQNQQTVLLAPTETLAEQHFHTFTKLTQSIPNLTLSLLTGKTPTSQRKTLLSDISSGSSKLIIGTHALFQDSIHFDNLGLIIIDEQQKFGVAQRLAMQSKSPLANLLILTATPIPRTLCMTLYNQLKISTIRTKPHGRIPPHTRLISEHNRSLIFPHVEQEIQQGFQIFWVCPFIEQCEQLQHVQDAQSIFSLLSQQFPNYRIALLHSQMTPQEKSDIPLQFAQKEYNILVASSIIEVGIDIPSATTIVIESADRFGLSSLHQLRGRVGRNSHPAYCFLVSSSRSDKAQKRLQVLCQSHDGFYIAEQDFYIRGPGEILGYQQHGFLPFKLGDMQQHRSISERARDDAYSFNLHHPQTLHNYLKLCLQRRPQSSLASVK